MIMSARGSGRHTHLAPLVPDGDVISLGALHLSRDEAFLVVGDPTVLLAVEGARELLHQLVAVHREVFKVGVGHVVYRHLGGWFVELPTPGLCSKGVAANRVPCDCAG